MNGLKVVSVIDVLERHWALTAGAMFAAAYVTVNYGIKAVLAALVLGMGALI